MRVTYTEGIPPQNGRDQQETNQCLQELPCGRVVTYRNTSKDRSDDRGAEEHQVVREWHSHGRSDRITYQKEDGPREQHPKEPFFDPGFLWVLAIRRRPLVHLFGSVSQAVFLIAHEWPPVASPGTV